MAVAVGTPSRTAPSGRPWRASLPTVLIGLGAVALAAVLLVNLGIQSNPPVGHGSTTSWLGDIEQTPCDTEGTCFVAPFDPGAGVGIGFTVRNSAPVPMTIVSVEGLEPPFLTPAYLHPELIDYDGAAQGYLFGLEAGRPFEPVEVAPGAEVPVQLIGTFVACEVAARSYTPGSALIIDHVQMTLRWAFFETRVNMPLEAALTLPAPESCPAS